MGEQWGLPYELTEGGTQSKPALKEGREVSIDLTKENWSQNNL